MLSANGNWIVSVDWKHVTPVINETAENSYIYFTFTHGQKTIKIIGTTAISEFPSWIILPLLLTATLAIMLCKRKLTKNR